MDKRVRKQYDEILRAVDAMTEPGNMTQEQALDFMEELSSDVDARIDGLRDDIKNRDESGEDTQ